MNTFVGTRSRSSPSPLWAQGREMDSFHHLPGELPANTECQGTACFLARHLNLAHWQNACAQSRRVYCLGKCYAAPATLAESCRPPITICSREGIVLKRLAEGSARTLRAYRERGGYEAL